MSNSSREFEAIRKRAELAVGGAGQATDPAARMLHELRVHQAELEMQNEELRRTHAELDALRMRYYDLYDLAPVGYCTLDGAGRIREANYTAAALLGTAKDQLTDQPFTRFIQSDDQDVFYLHQRTLHATRIQQTCELHLVRRDGSTFWAGMRSTLHSAADGALEQRLILGDISERKADEESRQQVEQELKAANARLQELLSQK